MTGHPCQTAEGCSWQQQNIADLTEEYGALKATKEASLRNTLSASCAEDAAFINSAEVEVKPFGDSATAICPALARLALQVQGAQNA
jgi:hypothetical protein